MSDEVMNPARVVPAVDTATPLISSPLLFISLDVGGVCLWEYMGGDKNMF